MSIRIKQEKCVGCGKCMESCPGNLIKKDGNGRAVIRRIQDCWGCTSCVKECQTKAITFFLGADVGGRGSGIHTEIRGDICFWIVEDSEGTTQRIEVNRKNANQY